jgi:predicted amidophosphoribosyltransferase
MVNRWSKSVQRLMAPPSCIWCGDRVEPPGLELCQSCAANVHVALIDAVLATGGAANELARALKRSSAESVEVWSVAQQGPGASRRERAASSAAHANSRYENW